MHDLATHLRRLADPDGYRPGWCPRCGGDVLHVHDYPLRKPHGEPDLPPVITIVRHICAELSCAATWRILPAFLARHLWHVWSTVERAVSAVSPPKRGAVPVPEKTVRGWRARLASAAKQLVVLLATSGGVLLEAIAKRAGHESTRFELVKVYAQEARTPPERRLADLAAIVHRLERGLRLM